MATIADIKQFMRYYNMPRDAKHPQWLSDADWERFGNTVVQSAYKSYFNDSANYGADPLRPSNMYKPAIVHVLNKFGYGLNNGLTSVKWNRSLAPLYGNISEALIRLLLTECNIRPAYDVPVTAFNGMLRGTADLVTDEAVVDVKTMSSYYFKSFCAEPDDDRGYITQLHVYAEGLQLSEMYVLALCKEYPSAALVKIDYEPECYAAIKTRLTHYVQADSVEYIRNCVIPKLVPNGRELRLPPGMTYDACRELLYVLTDPDAEFCRTALREYTHDEVLNNLYNYQEHLNA